MLDGFAFPMLAIGSYSKSIQTDDFLLQRLAMGWGRVDGGNFLTRNLPLHEKHARCDSDAIASKH